MIKQCLHIIMLIGFCLFLGRNIFAADAIKFYRYINDQGELILSNQIPPNDVKRGYEVLDKYGKVIDKVDPELTQAERDAQAADKARQENDKKILSLYASYDDIDRARKLSLDQLDASITITQENINGLIKQRATLQDSAADMERRGKTVPSDTTQKLFNIDKNIKSENKRLLEQQENRKQIADTFVADRIRLGELRGLAKPTAAPETELRPLKLPDNTPTAESGTTSLAPSNP